jgi:hypothetical protein
VIERRHQNGRWPLNLLIPNIFHCENGGPVVGSASRGTTLRALRVLRWITNKLVNSIIDAAGEVFETVLI